MSAVTSRPSVTGVSITATTGTVLIAATTLVRGLIRAVGTTGAAVSKEIAASQTSKSELRPLCACLREPTVTPQVLATVTRGLDAVGALKIRAAAELADLAVTRADPIKEPLRALETAETLREATDAHRALITAARAEHQRTFAEQLVRACSRASQAVGFSSVETAVGREGPTRVVATNEAGQALVTEIHTPEGHEPSIATEVLGLRDGTCNQILDRFDAVLEAEGVRASGTRRTFTGGVCSLEAAQRFARTRLHPEVPAQTNDAAAPTTETSHSPGRRGRRSRSTVRDHT